MKVGSKVRYAVMAIVDVAQHAESGAVPLADVAARQKISLSYLEQLFALLRRSGVVVSARGPGGGYRLAKPARETTIRAVFDAVDDPANGSDDHPASSGDSVTASLWTDLQGHISDFLDGVTVADVLGGRPAASMVNGQADARQRAGA
jgi:Rrf2 family iron-sulfur cluster assembly transcriptional regulator